MKTKNVIRGLIILCVVVVVGCAKDSNTQKQTNTTVGFIQAAVDTVCSGNLRIQGTHMFVYVDSSFFGGKEIYVGGYKSGDGEEIGLIIPWPADTGDLDFFSVYYDPLNDDSDPNDEADQYGSTIASVPQIARIERIKYSTDSLSILEIEVRMNCYPIINNAMDTVFVDDLIIRRN